MESDRDKARGYGTLGGMPPSRSGIFVRLYTQFIRIFSLVYTVLLSGCSLCIPGARPGIPAQNPVTQFAASGISGTTQN